MNPPQPPEWTDVLLGTERQQRVRVRQSLVAAGVYLGMGVILAVGVALRVVPWLPALLLTLFTLSMSAVFYAVIRSGLSLRVTHDPALTYAQGLVCVFACCACYLVAAPVRGAVLMTLMIGQVFGIFALTTSQAWRMVGVGVVALGLSMGLGAALDPLRFPPREELLHFLIVVLVLPTIGWLTSKLGGIRGKLHLQKVQLAQALAQNKLLATQDELTGLSNRRHMTSLLVAERGRQQRTHHPISMVLLDIDHFKRVNDGCGHQAGDQVLQIFADVITHGLRAGDALARWGGEEFLLMLPNTAADEARICVERMRSQLAARNFDHIARGLAVTFSAGVAVCGPEDRTDAIIERADRAMYLAKTGGRNRTVVA